MPTISPRATPRRAHTPLPIDDLGYVIVRIVESFIYSDQIVGRQSNLEVGREAIRALLSSPPRVVKARSSKRNRPRTGIP